MGRPVCSAAAHNRSQPGSARSISKTSMIAPRWPIPAAALELGRGGLGRVGGQEREHAQAIRGHRVELLDGPVVPRRITGALQRGVADRQTDRERPVDHRGPQVVAVHVLETQLGSAGAEAVVLDARAPDRGELLQQLPVRTGPAGAEHPVLAHPDVLAVALLDVQRALGLGAR